MAGLYIHIPFCKSKCIYCDFYSMTRLSAIEEVVNGIIREFESRKYEINEPFTTIYIGGGTPSVVPCDILLPLIEALPLDCVKEFTIEANPDNITHELVAKWKQAGINRVSLGVQTLDDKVLKSIGRRHNGRQAIEAIKMIAEGGINNISADLIYGLPGISHNRWEQDLDAILTTPITHLSAYSLTYTEGTMLYKMWQQNRVSPLSDEETELRFNTLRNMTAAAGFEHYEISNFAKSGYQSQHNSTYWEPTGKWLGLGPSAHSFDGVTRRIDIPDISEWLSALPRPYTIDEETDLDRVNDIIVTTLRTAKGLNLNDIPERYRHRVLESASRHIASGAITRNSDNLRIEQSRWLISDAYIRDLIIL